MPIIASFKDAYYDLMKLKSGEYIEIDGKDPEELALVAANIVEMLGDDEQSHTDFIKMAKLLATHWFNSKGHKFQEEPSESFFIYLMEAYVGKHDADNILEALTEEPPRPVVLSERSSALYKALRIQARTVTLDPLQQDKISATFDTLQELIAVSIVKKGVTAIIQQLFMQQMMELMSGGNPYGPSLDGEGNPLNNPDANPFFMMMFGGQPQDPVEAPRDAHHLHGHPGNGKARVELEEIDESSVPTPKKPASFTESKQQLAELAQREFIDTPVFEKVTKLMLLATRQQFDGIPEEDLVPIMENTRMLLNKEMDVEAYQDYAKNLQGSSSSALKILGIAMMAVATVFLCHFVAAAAAGAGVLATLGLGVAGAGFMGTGYSMFAHKPRGLCQAALETAETYDNSLTAQ